MLVVQPSSLLISVLVFCAGVAVVKIHQTWGWGNQNLTLCIRWLIAHGKKDEA